MNSKIKLLLISLSLTVGGVSGAFAADDGTIAVAPTTPSENSQAGKRDGKRAQGALEQRLEQLDKTLQLTADQKQQIKDIWTKEATAAKDAGAGKDRRAALMKTHDAVRAILTPAQQAKFDDMNPERKGAKAKGKKAK